MELNRKREILSFQNKVFDELYQISTLINLTKTFCEEREFKGEYYGTTKKQQELLSGERNNYINMLSLASSKIDCIVSLNLDIEKILSL